MSFDLPNPFLRAKPLEKDRSKLGSVVGDEGRRLMDDLLGSEELVHTSDEEQAPGDQIMLSSSEQRDDALLEFAIAEGETLENYKLLQEARELLGEQNVHGVKDVEFALGYSIDRSKVPPIPYTREDFLKSKEIKEKMGVEEMLILCVADKDGKPLTMKRMEEIFQPRYEEMRLGKVLREMTWFREEPFYKDLGLTYEWKLMTKQCIPDSMNRPHHWQSEDVWPEIDSQEYAIEQYGQGMGIPSFCFKRPEPWGISYAISVHLLNTENHGEKTGERILKDKIHWSNFSSLEGDLVCIGVAEYGYRVDGFHRESKGRMRGVCLSRSPLGSLSTQHDPDGLK